MVNTALKRPSFYAEHYNHQGDTIMTGEKREIKSETYYEQSGKLGIGYMSGGDRFQISFLHPRRLAKGLSSTITVQIYLPYKRDEVVSIIEQLQELESSELIENKYSSVLIPGQTVIIKLSSSTISFSDEVLKELRGEDVNRITFSAKPDDECALGRQAAVLSIKNSETNEEYESIPCFFIIDDFAFDHVSKPILSYASSVVSGVGSLALFTLSFLQKLDATLGIPVGTVGAALAILLSVRPTFLYKQESKTQIK